jgi:hypothetical protein
MSIVLEFVFSNWFRKLCWRRGYLALDSSLSGHMDFRKRFSLHRESQLFFVNLLEATWWEPRIRFRANNEYIITLLWPRPNLSFLLDSIINRNTAISCNQCVRISFFAFFSWKKIEPISCKTHAAFMMYPVRCTSLGLCKNNLKLYCDNPMIFYCFGYS